MEFKSLKQQCLSQFSPQLHRIVLKLFKRMKNEINIIKIIMIDIRLKNIHKNANVIFFT